jgi:hypothetical protein
MEPRGRATGGAMHPQVVTSHTSAALAYDRRTAAMRVSALTVVPGSIRRPPPPFANLRRNVCPHFFITGSRGALPIQAPHLLKALIRQSSTTSRCQLRGGVHLAEDFVNDVCLAARFNQCVFYEDDLTGEQ